MEIDSKIFVAGHKGLVGSAILRRLHLEGYTRLITRTHRELDLCRQSEVEAFFEAERPEYIFVAAARVGGILANSTLPAEFIYQNLMIQTNLIESAYKSGVTKLLFLGSSCIYPRDCPQPMKEDALLSGRLESTNEAYAIAKIAGIKMCQSYNRQYGSRFISVMPTNLYGPGDNFDLETSHVLPALIRKFHEAKLHKAKRLEVEGRRSGESQGDKDGDFVTIWGSGASRREFLYVDDLADACLFLMENYDRGEIINVGVGKDISIHELCGLIRSVVGFDGEVRFDSSKPDGTPQKLLDVSRLGTYGWRSRIPLREGIHMTYEWYQTHLPRSCGR